MRASLVLKRAGCLYTCLSTTARIVPDFFRMWTCNARALCGGALQQTRNEEGEGCDLSVTRYGYAFEVLRWGAVTLFSARALKAVQCELAHFGLAAANMLLDACKCRGGVAGADGVENRAMFLVGLVETIAVHEI